MSSATRGDRSRPVADQAATEPEPDGAGPSQVQAEGHGEGQSEEQAEEQASVDVMRLLSEHVPLTLLADLAQPKGPDSPDILEHEGLPDVAWWKSAAEEQH